MIGFLRLPALNSLQLLDEVFGVLAGDDRGWPGCRELPSARVAGGADLRRDRLALGQVGLGGGRRVGRHRGERTVQALRQQAASSREAIDFMSGDLVVRAQNLRILQCAPSHVRPSPSTAAPAQPPPKHDTPAKQALAWTHTARFLTTASQLDQLPATELPEIAFVGRSNAGKSTAINTLTQQKRLAFASKTPGRTQHINLFALGQAGAPMRCSPTCPATATPRSSAAPSCAGSR